ncbi:penicillin-binding transpeptidase domain-containing protein, partial [Klebsiella pneumoniae]|nr:penicillin-binding transpeptidase domain-containing protein [Klebsiella pneumoniae]
MNPANGKILSMVSYDRENPDNNTCISNRFPAASIFKIVTAAAAIEKCGFNSESEISFVGGKHTLYKSQIRNAGGYGMS